MLMKPTVGRAVHLYGQSIADRDPTQPGYGFNGQGTGPYAATITQVFTNADGEVTYCNLHVTPPFGEAFHQGSVPEKDSTFDFGAGGLHWVWPPRS